MGWSPDFIAAANWALGSALGALALILLAPVSGLSPDFLTLLVVPALGAALVGQFDSIVLTLVGALAIGIGEAEVGLFTTAPGWAEAAPLIVIVGILMIRKPTRYDRSNVAQRLARVGTGVMRWGALVAAVAGILLVLFVSVNWISPITTSVVLAVTMLSIVVLTGYAGQLSLAQFGLAGMSAFFMALFSARWGWPLWASILLAIVLTVPVGMVVAIPAFRTTGAAFAIATLSLVVVIEDLILGNPSTAGWMKSGTLPPLELFGYKFDIIGHPRHYAVLVMVVLILVCLVVANLRRSAMGRRLLAIRTNPGAAAALGVNPASMKLYGFAVAAVITAICGALLEAQLSFAEFGTFSTFGSITSVLQTTIGGVGMVAGRSLRQHRRAWRYRQQDPVADHHPVQLAERDHRSRRPADRHAGPGRSHVAAKGPDRRSVGVGAAAAGMGADPGSRGSLLPGPFVAPRRRGRPTSGAIPPPSRSTAWS